MSTVAARASRRDSKMCSPAPTSGAEARSTARRETHRTSVAELAGKRARFRRTWKRARCYPTCTQLPLRLHVGQTDTAERVDRQLKRFELLRRYRQMPQRSILQSVDVSPAEVIEPIGVQKLDVPLVVN